MTTSLPDYVVERLRMRMPPNGHVVPGSTPVLSFGNAAEAAVATLGLNPSRQEFLDKYGRELTGGSRRFETLASLGVSELATASESVLRRIIQGCNKYFGVNPYTRWFNQLEPILQAAHASYYDGSACHLDLVQWATDPVWSKIPDPAVRERLLELDASFLRHQIANGSLRLLLINGNGVARHFQSVMGVTLRPAGGVSGASVQSQLSVGILPQGTRVIAWSINVQSSFGVCNGLRTNIAHRVAELSASDAIA